MITIKKIICPVDFSELSRKSLQYANEFAKLSGGEVFLVGVIENDPTINYSHGLDAERAEAEKKLALLIDEEQMAGIVSDYVIYEGFAEECIIDYAKRKEADVIVMGSHGRRGLKRMILGSVAEHVVRRAPCPVLIVKENEHEFIK
ncbi:universal stress protein [Chlorobium sp. BLA1]|uniref:UspA n=1 Tax=Chlorobium ferrooxidans DSM 13031 TaxID=377431 RepID=Q0YUV1_9CHLB|nr:MULTISPECIES: universal stress protein [Chlorobium]EAT59935.1 UspA [Chlorobium ferrooxidans DSM 13031]NHQ60179.1 universal stress protein [Candidatus Chlorobium masyuteum]NTU44558.1 universal stress protein [Chlorobiaceae bacterium]